MLRRIFQLETHGTTPAREIQAGLTTFAAMAYILAVNPSILAQTGMDRAALVTVTALSAAAATTIMALATNYPLALAPGMGINAFFTYTICLGAGVPWQQALGMVFVNGAVFLLLSLSGTRERIRARDSLRTEARHHLRHRCVHRLHRAQEQRHHRGESGHPGHARRFHQQRHGSRPRGLALMLVLVARRVPGAIALAIAGTTMAGVFVGNGQGGAVTTLPAAWLSLPASPAPLLLQLDLSFLTGAAAFVRVLPLIVTLLLVDMFDNIGTLIGVSKRAGLLDGRGNLPNVGRVLVADSIAAMLSALLGTSTVVSYIESASGVEAGGRTGLTALTTAACFLLAHVATPLVLAVPAAAIAPALIVVGVFMLQSAAEIEMDDFATAAPAALTLIAIPLTASVAGGLGIGLL